MGTLACLLLAASALGAKVHTFEVPIAWEGQGRVSLADAVALPDGDLVVSGQVFGSAQERHGPAARIDPEGKRLVWQVAPLTVRESMGQILVSERGLFIVSPSQNGGWLLGFDAQGVPLPGWDGAPPDPSMRNPFEVAVGKEPSDTPGLRALFVDAAGQVAWREEPPLPVPAAERRKPRVDAVAIGQTLAVAGTWTVRRGCGPEAECDVAQEAWLGLYGWEHLGFGPPQLVALGPASEPAQALAASSDGRFFVAIGDAEQSRILRVDPDGTISAASELFPGRVDLLSIAGDDLWASTCQAVVRRFDAGGDDRLALRTEVAQKDRPSHLVARHGGLALLDATADGVRIGLVAR